MFRKSRSKKNQRLIAHKIVDSERLTKISLVLPAVQVVAHAGPVAQRFAVCRSVLFAVKAVGLFKEEEGVTVGAAAGRRGRTNVVGDEGLVGSQGVVRTGLEARLNPVKNGAETTPGGERSVKVQGDNHVGGRGVRNSEGDVGSGLGVCSDGKDSSAQ